MYFLKFSEFKIGTKISKEIFLVGTIYSPEYGISSFSSKYAWVQFEITEDIRIIR